MPKLRMVRDNLLQTVADDEIDMEDFLLLYEINQSKKLRFFHIGSTKHFH